MRTGINQECVIIFKIMTLVHKKKEGLDEPLSFFLFVGNAL